MNKNDLAKFEVALKETSLNTANGVNEYITHSMLKAINFDKVKDNYVKELKLTEIPKSNDALFIYDPYFYFIEFKSGEIDSVKNLDIKIKIYDSLLILLDILKENISFAREYINYILVYNDEKEHTSRHFKKGAKQYMYDHMAKKSKKEFVNFNLEKYKNLYFKEVHTYTYEEFEKGFINKFENNN